MNAQDQDYHEGPVIVRHTKTHTLILCPVGHYVTSQDKKDWAGSWMEAKVGRHQVERDWIVKCFGAMPQPK